MDNDKFEYRNDDPVTISEEAREAMKKSPYYFDLNKLKNEKFYMMVTERAPRGYGKAYAIMKRGEKHAQTIDKRAASES